MLDDTSAPEAQAALRQLLDSTEAGLVVLDPELRYLYINAALARAHGLSAREHLGRSVAEVLPGVDVEEPVLRAVLADGRPRVTHSQGVIATLPERSEQFWHGAYHRLEDPDGRVLGVVGVLLEITDDRTQRRALEQAQARLALLDEAALRIGTTLDMDTTCAELADFLVPLLADAASVEVVPIAGSTRAPEGALRLRRAATAAVPELRAAVREFAATGQYVDYQRGSSNERCVATGLPVVSNRPDDDRMARAAPAPERVSAYRKMGMHSALMVPLTARGQTIGTATLVRAGASPPFSHEDTVNAQDLAVRAAISLDNARRYTAEHNAAVDLQRALLAAPGTPQPGVQVAYRYRPAGEGALVGGDWFEIARLPGGRTMLAIGDVMGHGLEAAVQMSLHQALLRVVAAADLRPDAALARLDELLRDVGAERPATCLVAVLDPASGRSTLASAGHLPPALVAPDGTVELLPVPPGPPLGVGADGYELFECPCRPGHTLLFYTDGLVERRTEDIDRSLARLTALRLDGGASPEALLTQVLDEVAPERAEDDLALVAARPHA